MAGSKLPANVLKLVTYPNPVLRHKCSHVAAEDIASRHIQQLVADMLATVRHEDGLGLAAPQVGATDRVFVMRTPIKARRGPRGRMIARGAAPQYHALINPTIRRAHPSTAVWPEGCLSLPDYSALVRRKARIEVAYFTPEGEAVWDQLQGLSAAIFQHELDHLDGLLITDRELPGSGEADELDGAWQAAEARMANALAKEFGDDPWGHRAGT